MIKYVATASAGILIGVALASYLHLPSRSVATSSENSTEVIETNVSTEDEKEAPAYMLVLGEVLDGKAFGEGYVSKLPPLYEKFGGHYIALGGGVEVLEGEYAPPSYVIGKWPSMDAARAFWNSPEYDELKQARIDGGWGDFDVLLVKGLPE